MIQVSSGRLNMGLKDSTTTPLVSPALTYTGAAFSVNGYGRLVGSATADVNGTLYVEQSSDGGANWDVVSSFVVTGGKTVPYSVEAVCPHARLRYVSGSTQATFRLYVFARTT